MDLQDFISETLIQIINGVKDAQSRTGDTGSTISPNFYTASEHASAHGFIRCSNGFAQVVQFDVALTTTEGTGKKAGIGILAGAISLGTSGQTSSENASTSRIRFSVPLILPQQA